MAHLDTVQAYIELPAFLFAKDEKFTGASLVAINIVAVKRVQGPGLAVQATPPNSCRDLVSSAFLLAGGTRHIADITG